MCSLLIRLIGLSTYGFGGSAAWFMNEIGPMLLKCCFNTEGQRGWWNLPHCRANFSAFVRAEWLVCSSGLPAIYGEVSKTGGKASVVLKSRYFGERR